MHPKQLIHNLLKLDIKGRSVQVDPIPLTVPDLPSAFHLARVAVVADLHLPDQLMAVPRLLRCIALQKPDAIFLPGDLTNRYADFDAEGLAALAKGLTAIAPCFAVPGNHELKSDHEPDYRRILTEAGVQYLFDSYGIWEKDGATLPIYGMARRRPPHPEGKGPHLMLAHHPEYMPLYRQAGWNIVVSGHTHGGHVRVGSAALYAPGQGFLPRYTHGVYTEGDTRLIVSRGLGNSSLPWRVGNPPHLPLLVLSAK